MIREKNYSLIKAIIESSCCSKSEGGGGETTFDDVVKYYTGFSPDEILDWKVLQGNQPDTLPPSFPLVKVPIEEDGSFFSFIGEHNITIDDDGNALGTTRGEVSPSTSDYPAIGAYHIYELKMPEPTS